MARRNASTKACHCGYRMGDPAIVEEAEHGLLGWLALSLVGITLRPDYISYRCMYCREELATSRDPKLLSRRSSQKAKAPTS